MTKHEYSVIGQSRVHTGRWLGIAASALGGLAITLLLVFRDWAVTKFQIQLPNAVALPLLGGVFYALFYYLFNEFGWRWEWSRKLTGIPDISGEWNCIGTRLSSVENPDDPSSTSDTFGSPEWPAAVTISQSWEQISISLTSNNSTSDSKSAALLMRADGRFVLMYSYDNEPDISMQEELSSHVGYCELLFSKDCSGAKGSYFNNRGRITHGKMELTRKVKEAKK